ncbi:MAG TPA: ribonuclease HII [Fimbriimonadaceae bacterium]|jgi:ribonuclease HII
MRRKEEPRLKHLPGVAGLDEAGRGPLAGPVFAAAVILPKGFHYKGLNDSKQLDAKRREELAIRIKRSAIWAVTFADVEEIDRLNILWASMAAMARALSQLSVRPEQALVDGNKLPKDLPCEAKAIVDGDAKYACIAAASILAKTARDKYMKELCPQYPEYGFSQHFGYSTPQHKRALAEFGPCEIHRKTFWPCRLSLQPELSFEEEIPQLAVIN